jgi:hypothetical protein
MQQDGRFTGDRCHCAFLPAFASVLSQLHAPSTQVAVDSPGAENVVRGLHQECSQVRIALFADVHLVTYSRRSAARKPWLAFSVVINRQCAHRELIGIDSALPEGPTYRCGAANRWELTHANVPSTSHEICTAANQARSDPNNGRCGIVTNSVMTLAPTTAHPRFAPAFDTPCTFLSALNHPKRPIITYTR